MADEKGTEYTTGASVCEVLTGVSDIKQEVLTVRKMRITTIQ